MSYTNSLNVHNEWSLPLKGIWVAYNNSTDGSSWFDNLLGTPLPIGADQALPGTITSHDGVADNWTVTILDSHDRLWATKQFINENISHDSGSIELTVIGGGGKPEKVEFRYPSDTDPDFADLNRV